MCLDLEITFGVYGHSVPLRAFWSEDESRYTDDSGAWNGDRVPVSLQREQGWN